jgi:5S rRNA maturation endonuclease (ribonuclease M5)
MDYEKTLEELEKTIVDLIEENKTTPVIVEGEKDVNALRKLGLTGEIITLNKGMSIPNFCDMISQKYKKVILLTDWDKKGGRLCFILRKNLESLVKCDIDYRGYFAKRSMSRTIEGLTTWINTLKKKIEQAKTHTFN